VLISFFFFLSLPKGTDKLFFKYKPHRKISFRELSTHWHFFGEHFRGNQMFTGKTSAEGLTANI
jgi:hypothetical protein